MRHDSSEVYRVILLIAHAEQFVLYGTAKRGANCSYGIYIFSFFLGTKALDHPPFCGVVAPS